MNNTETELRDEIMRISGANPKKCMKCGKCSATCPALDSMDIHPHRFVKNVRDGKINELLKSDTIWACLSCFVCSERCPRDAGPAALIDSVRVLVIRQQGGNYLCSDDIPEIVGQDKDIPQQLVVSVFRKYMR